MRACVRACVEGLLQNYIQCGLHEKWTCVNSFAIFIEANTCNLMIEKGAGRSHEMGSKA